MIYSDDEREFMEEFDAEIDDKGCAATVADDGIVIGFNVAKLNELLELAGQSPVGKVAISMPFSNDDVDPDSLLN